MEWRYVGVEAKDRNPAFAARLALALRNRLKKVRAKGVFTSPTNKNRVRVCIRLRTRVVFLDSQRQRKRVYPNTTLSMPHLRQLFRLRRNLGLHLVEDDNISKQLFATMDKRRPPGIRRRIEGYRRPLHAQTNIGYARFFFSTKRAPLESWISQWNRTLRKKRYKLYLYRSEQLASNNLWKREWRTILLYKQPFATHLHIKSARAWKHPKLPQYATNLFFSSAGARRLQRTTGRHTGQRVAFVIAGVVYKTEIIPQQLQQGNWRIRPNSLKTQEQAAHDVRSLALLLQTSLPGAIKRYSSRLLSPGSASSTLCRSMEEQVVPHTIVTGTAESQTIVFTTPKVVVRKQTKQRTPLKLQASTTHNCLAKIHDSLCLSLPLFQMLYRKALKNQHRNRREAKTDPQGSKSRFLQICIGHILLAHEAWRRGLDVAEIELQRSIERNREFAKDGQFSRSFYESQLKNWQLVDREYKQWLRIKTLANYFRNQQQKRIHITVEKARRYYTNQAIQIQLQYMKFDRKRFRPGIPGLSKRERHNVLRRGLQWLLKHWRQQHNSQRLLARLKKTIFPSSRSTAKPLPRRNQPAPQVLKEIGYALRSKHKAWQTPYFRKNPNHWLPGLGSHAELQQKLFALRPAQPFLTQPVLLGSHYYLIKLHKRWVPSAQQFQQEREEVLHRLRLRNYYLWESKTLQSLQRHAKIHIKKNLL